MNTSENAPLSWGRTSSADDSKFLPSCAAISAVMISVSVVALSPSSLLLPTIFASFSARSPVLVKFPLWASARVPWFVARRVGWALFQVDEPVVL